MGDELEKLKKWVNATMDFTAKPVTIVCHLRSFEECSKCKWVNCADRIKAEGK